MLLENRHVLLKHIGHKILTFGFVVSFRYTKQKSDAAKLLSVAAKREGLALYETEKMLEVGQPADLETKGKRLKMELPTELEEIGHPESERKPKM